MTDKLNREELLELAIKSGLTDKHGWPEIETFEDALERFAALLSARQEQAEPLDRINPDNLRKIANSDHLPSMRNALINVANALRSPRVATEDVGAVGSDDSGDSQSMACAGSSGDRLVDPALVVLRPSQPQEPIKASADEREPWGWAVRSTMSPKAPWQLYLAARADDRESVEFMNTYVRDGKLAYEIKPLFDNAALPIAQPAAQTAVPDVDWLAQVIRCADGNHTLGAGALAEKIVEAMLSAAPQPVAAQVGNWRVRERRNDAGELLDCFVEAPKEGDMPYALEVLGDDYTGYGDIERKLEHCKLIVSLVNAAHPQAAQAKENE